MREDPKMDPSVKQVRSLNILEAELEARSEIADVISGKNTNIAADDLANGVTISPSFEMCPSSSDVIPHDESFLSNNVDRWMGCVHSTETTGVQDSRLLHQSPLNNMTATLDQSTIWYILAVVLPIFSIDQLPWRCTSCPLASAVEICVAQLARLFSTARIRVQRFAEEESARDIFTLIMDIFRLIYAFGFLILSIYQANA